VICPSSGRQLVDDGIAYDEIVFYLLLWFLFRSITLLGFPNLPEVFSERDYILSFFRQRFPLRSVYPDN